MIFSREMIVHEQNRSYLHHLYWYETTEKLSCSTKKLPPTTSLYSQLNFASSKLSIEFQEDREVANSFDELTSKILHNIQPFNVRHLA